MDICRTASQIKSLNLIVSVDTMVAHLAGALGKKIYLLLQSDADWRWLRNREDAHGIRVSVSSGSRKPVIGSQLSLGYWIF